MNKLLSISWPANKQTNRQAKRSGFLVKTHIQAGVDCQALRNDCARTIVEGGMGFSSSCLESVFSFC
jgi:hypothetical protein